MLYFVREVRPRTIAGAALYDVGGIGYVNVVLGVGIREYQCPLDNSKATRAYRSKDGTQQSESELCAAFFVIKA